MHTVKLMKMVRTHPIQSVLVGIVVLYLLFFSPRLLGIADESITPSGVKVALAHQSIEIITKNASASIAGSDVFMDTLQLDDWIKTTAAATPEYAAALDFAQYTVVVQALDGYRLYFDANIVIVQNVYASNRYASTVCYTMPGSVTNAICAWANTDVE